MFEERHDVGIGHRDPVTAVTVARQAVAVLVGKAVEVVLGDGEHVVDVGDVLAEAHADVDESRRRGAHLVADVGRELVAGQPDVAPREGQQPGPFAIQAGRFVGGRELGDRGGDRGVEREVDEPSLEPFLGERGRLPGRPPRDGRRP